MSIAFQCLKYYLTEIATEVTVRLSSKVTFTRISDASRTRFRRVLHLFQSVSGKKGRGTHVHLAAALLRVFALVQMHSGRILLCDSDVSCTCFRCISHTFRMHADITFELSCTINSLHMSVRPCMELFRSFHSVCTLSQCGTRNCWSSCGTQ